MLSAPSAAYTPVDGFRSPDIIVPPPRRVGWTLVDRMLEHYLIMGRELHYDRHELLPQRVQSMEYLLGPLESYAQQDYQNPDMSIFGYARVDRSFIRALRDIKAALRFMRLLDTRPQSAAWKAYGEPRPIETYRAQYDRLSRAFLSLLKNRYEGSGQLFVFTCPLYKRLWLQAGQYPLNPYLGDFWPHGGTAVFNTAIGTKK